MISYEEAIELLTSKDNFYIDLGLERIKLALEKFGKPQDGLKYIHVAGTNGKGSVCAITESILREAGYKTGLYTSPHIWDYTERIQICGNSISKEDFAAYTEKIVNCGVHLTEFEILTVMMFLYFKDNHVDIAVIETGLGGRLDATNVIKENLCSVITQIDLDHTDRLGDTKEKIAFEKAGIIKPDCPVITSMAFETIRDRANECNSLFILVSPAVPEKYTNALTLKGIHQTENLALVLEVINYLFNDIKEDTILNGLKKVHHPCRFEYIKQKNLIIDACHNPNGIQALRDNLDLYFPNENRRFIFGALKRKDYKRMMDILFRDNDEIYLNEFDYPDSCTFEELKAACPYNPKRYTKDKFNMQPDKLNIICGSFYMLSGMENFYQ